jgi:hypothetical protein
MRRTRGKRRFGKDCTFVRSVLLSMRGQGQGAFSGSSSNLKAIGWCGLTGQSTGLRFCGDVGGDVGWRKERLDGGR